MKTVSKDEEHIAFHIIKDISTKRFLRMAEAIFHGRHHCVSIYAEQKEIEQDKPKRSVYALVVETGKTYKEALKDVKDAIRSNPASSAIKTIRSTRDGKILITTDRNEDKVRELTEGLKRSKETLEVRQVGNRNKETSLFLRGMDADTTTAEIKIALAKVGDIGAYKLKHWVTRFSDLYWKFEILV